LSENPSFTLLLDAGGFSGGLGSINKIKTDFLLNGYKMMNYSAINLGYRDFLHGTNFLKQLQQKYDVLFVSANIYNVETKEPFVQRYLIKHVKSSDNSGELRVGIFGVEAKNSSLIPAHRRHGGALLEARDPVINAKEVIAQMKDEVDIIICLAHMRLQQAKTFATKVPEIDFIILGNDFRNQNSAIHDVQTQIVSASRQGKYMGDLTIYLDENKKIIRHSHLTSALDETYKEIPEYAKLYEDFKKEIMKGRQ